MKKNKRVGYFQGIKGDIKGFLHYQKIECIYETLLKLKQHEVNKQLALTYAKIFAEGFLTFAIYFW